MSGLRDDASRLLDSALDRLVVPGFSALGTRVRRLLPTWPADPPADALRGRQIAVTGASSGLGLATVMQVLALGGRAHLVVRDLAKGERILAELSANGPVAAELWVCDLSDPASIDAFVARVRDSGVRLDGLVHNAGLLPPKRTTSPDGHELTMAVHVLGPIRMTEGLVPTLADGARIVLVTSGGMYTSPLPADDPDFVRGKYSGAVAYARSKRTQIELLPRLQSRWGQRGITVHAMHPGWAATPGIDASLPGFSRFMGPVLRSAEEGADTTTWLLATDPAPEGGRLWHERSPRPTHLLPFTRPTAAELETMWGWVCDAVGLEGAARRA